MKTQSKLIALGLVVVSLLLTSAPAVLAFPPMPSSFWGTVKVDGANVPDGAIVSAWINGVKYAEMTVLQPADDTVYGLNVPGDDLATPGTIEGGVEGDTVVFYIGDLVADQTGTWHSSTNVELNLTASTPTQQTIIVEKQTDPDGAPDAFTFSGDATGTISDGEQIVVSNLQPGTYTSQETVPAGWDLTSIVCDDSNSSGNVRTRTATFQLDPGEQIICTFTNVQISPGPIYLPLVQNNSVVALDLAMEHSKGHKR